MKRRIANILAFVFPALLAYQVGLLALGRHLVDWNSLAAAAHAFDVFHKLPQANMALIGFVQPPLPALLYLPLSYVCPNWLATGYCAPVIGAVFLGLSALLLVHLGQALRLRWWVYGAVTALFVVHPLVLSYAALGHPALILVFAYIGLAKGLLGWHRDQTVRDLVAAAIYGAVAVLVAYEAAAPVLAAALFILGCCRTRGLSGTRGRGFQPRLPARMPADQGAASGLEAPPPKGGPAEGAPTEGAPTEGAPAEGAPAACAPARAEGTLIAFLLPAVYVAAVWLVANWVIMGTPLYFWRMTLAGTQQLPVKPVDGWLQPVVIVGFMVQPLLLALIYNDLRPASVSRRGTPVAWLALAALFSPLLFPTLRTTSAGAALWAPLMPIAAAGAGLGFPLLLAFANSFAETAAVQRRRLVSAGFTIIALASLVMALHLQTHRMGLPTGFRSTFTGYEASSHTDVDERAAAERLRQGLNPTMRNYIAGWPGFAIALYSGLVGSIEVLPTAEPPPGDLGLQAGSTIVLLANGHDARAAWQARLPRHLALAPKWTIGKWTGYRVTVKRQ